MFAGYIGLEMGVMQVLDASPVWFAEIDQRAPESSTINPAS